MTKWEIITEIEKYGRLKYAPNRHHMQLVEILTQLQNNDRRIVILNGVISFVGGSAEDIRSWLIIGDSERFWSLFVVGDSERKSYIDLYYK